MTNLVESGVTPAGVEALVNKQLPEQHGGTGLELSPAKVLVWLGAFDAAVDARGNNTDNIIAWAPYPPAFRNSSGFERTLELLGVTDYWRKHGYPPQCRAIGAKDFHCD